MTTENDISIYLQNLMDQGIPPEIKAIMGKSDGEMYAGVNKVFVTLYNGQVIEVYNDRVPLVPYRKIKIGYDQAMPATLQVLYFDSVYDFNPTPNIPNHSESHEWWSYDPLMVSGEQFIPGLALPIPGTLIIQYYGSVYYLNSGIHHINKQVIDLSASVPASGAQWGMVQADAAGAITVVLSSVVDGRGLLVYSDIPDPDPDNAGLFVVKLYAGQVEFIKTKIETDIIDIRFSGISSGGLTGLDPNRVVLTNASGNIVTDANIGWNPTGGVLTLGGLSAEFDPAGGHNAIYQGNDGFSTANLLETFGTGVASFITGLRGRGTHLLPTAVQADDILFRLRGRAYDGAASVGLTSVEIELIANEIHTPSAHGTRLEFYTTPNGSLTSTKALTIAHDGSAQLLGALSIPASGLIMGGFTLTVPATGTAALLGVANIFTTQQMVDGTSDQIQLKLQGHSIQTANILTIEDYLSANLLSVDNTGNIIIGNPNLNNAIISIRKLVSITSGYLMALDFQPTLISSANHIYGIFAYPLIATIPSGKWFIGITAGLGSLVISTGTGTYAGLFAQQPDALTGTLATAYGLYIAGINKATVNYAIYTNAGLNRFGDQLSIVGSADRTQLQVTGFTTQAVATAMAQITRNDAAAGVSAILGLTALGSGANGDGGSVLLNGKSSTTAAQAMGLIDYRWIDATHASRKAAVRMYAYDTAARLGLEIEASGTIAKLAFYGGTTVVRGAALTAQLTTITHTAPGTPDYAIQDFAQNGGAGIWGFVDHDEANSVLKVIDNLQVRVAELEARLGSATGINIFA